MSEILIMVALVVAFPFVLYTARVFWALFVVMRAHRHAQRFIRKLSEQDSIADSRLLFTPQEVELAFRSTFRSSSVDDVAYIARCMADRLNGPDTDPGTFLAARNLVGIILERRRRTEGNRAEQQMDA